MDGYVIIGTQLDTKQLEADIKNAKKELSQFQKEEEKLLKEKGKVELQLTAYDEEKAKIKANTDELLKKAETEAQVTNLLNMENSELDKLTQKYSKQFGALDEVNDKLKDNQLQQGLINGKIDEANTKLSQAKGYENVANQMGKIKDKTSDVVKQVGRWALAIFSVRSAYMFIRQRSSTLAQYNKEYGANLEYIRYALAQMIAPVLQFLVNLAFKLLTYVNYIAKAWFGVNLFSNASSKNFNKMAGSAEKIRKSLQATAFDEMNVLSDTSSTSGGAGVTMPSVDLSKQDIPIPSWLQWIADNKDNILGFFEGLALAIAGIKIADLLNDLGLLGKGISNIGVIIRGLGIGLALYGVIELVKDLIDLVNNPSWEKFSEVLLDISFILAGIGLVVGGPTGIKMAILGAILAIVGAVIQNWDTIKETLDKIFPFIRDYIIQPIIDTFKKFTGLIVTIFTTIISIVNGVFTTVLSIIDGVMYTAILLFQDLFQSVCKILNGIKEVFVGVFTGDLKRALNGFIEIFAGVFDSLWGIAKVPLNLIITAINSLIKGVNKFSIKVPDWVPEIGGRNFGFNIPTIKYLKTGGIINLPSRGVPVGTNAYGGEAGAEGVIPLTDSQAMETLGEAIGRYITINANIVNNMNGRVISRQLQQIKGNQDFAYNK